MKPAIKHLDLAALYDTLSQMSPASRREWFIKINMSARGRNLNDIAQRNGIKAPWYLSKVITGEKPMTPRIFEALEKSLEISLVPFLTKKDVMYYVGKIGRKNARK